MATRGRRRLKGKPTAEVLEATGIDKQRLYYLEQKGFVKPERERVREKEFRYYSEGDVARLRTIKPYLDQGLRYRVAMDQTLKDLASHKGGRGKA